MKYKMIFDGKVTEQQVAFALRDEFGRDAKLIEFDVDRLSRLPYALVEVYSGIPQGALEVFSVRGVPVAEVIPMRYNEKAQETSEEDKVEENEKPEPSIDPIVDPEPEKVEEDSDGYVKAPKTFRIPGTSEIVTEGTKFKIVRKSSDSE